ncbi:hypothetical protein BJY00DRAFT_287692 [Aspergillus carlsbadensis]|nr:hypothetical protein BJY00DRAFT_287692 [Aspergillus carlsbadensis]
MLKELCTLLLVRENRSRLPYPCYPPLCWALLHHTRATTSELHVHVNIRSAHRRMLINCIRLMSTRLKKDICNLGAPATLFQAIPIHRVAESIPPELRYSCLYWGRHLQMSGIDVYDNDFIHGFLTKHLLHWLEVLSLIGRAPEAICVTSELFSRVSVSNLPLQAHSFIAFKH